MRCRDAKIYIAAQREGDLAESDAAALKEHLTECPDCRALEQRERSLDTLLSSSAPHTPVQQAHVSTEHIMQAVQQQRQISQQLEDIRKQQQSRVARLRPFGAASAAIVFFTLGSIPLLLLAIILIQTDLVVKAVSSPLNGVIDMLFISGQYLQTELTWVTRNNLLLSAIAFAFVVMMGVWLRLMRHPQET
ncbi:MAG: zf-HC2 domain-containing protein [Ktedonobacteraceae bacterium]|nr:zf-HC2 domain-containing protein [Ktedonobacteraceae bacterium]